MDVPLTEEQRFPLLSPRGRETLLWMREHSCAPRFNHHCGDRLTGEALQRVLDYESALHDTGARWQWGETPQWLQEFAARCQQDVPFYRRRGTLHDDFFSLPITSRAELGREPWAFVPDSQPLDNLIVYNTSGTTGHPLDILCHPEASSKYLPLMRLAMEKRGVQLKGDSRVGMVLVCAQKSTYTFATLSSYMGEAGFIKLNLNPADWRDPDDRIRFLVDCNPEVYSGDPISFYELMQLPLKSRPKALVSTAMALLPGLQQKLEKHFDCPVVDLYSMNESGPITVATDRGHEILPHDLYVEVLRPDGTPCAPGERGEVTLSGGRNPFLPLLRYRTGDWASMSFPAGGPPVLVELEGRPPTLFRSTSGKVVNNIDVSGALRKLPLSQFKLHQNADGSLVFTMRDNESLKIEVRRILLDVFGAEQKLTFESLVNSNEQNQKVVQYTSDLME